MANLLRLLKICEFELHCKRLIRTLTNRYFCQMNFMTKILFCHGAKSALYCG